MMIVRGILDRVGRGAGFGWFSLFSFVLFDLVV
jgi:hypothetical protein